MSADLTRESERETRCYAVTGSAQTLEAWETLLRRLASATEGDALQIVSVLIDGRSNAALTMRTLATWIEEE